MDKKYTAMDIANYIVLHANDERNNLSNYSLTPLKLQKILYYVSTEYFKKFGKRLFSEDFQKWQYGPVVKDVYHEFKSFGFHHIAKPKATLEIGAESSTSITRKEFDATSLMADADFMVIAKPVIGNYMPWEAFNLVERTHQEGAWRDFEASIMKGIELIYSDAELAIAKSISDQ